MTAADRWLVGVVASFLVAAGLWQLVHTPTWPEGVLVAPDAPDQGPILTEGPTWDHHGVSVRGVAAYRITARVLGVRHYGDAWGAWVPWDAALGWGRMSDSRVLDRLRIGQGDRWYTYRWEGRVPPLPLGELVSSSANVHLMPADENVSVLLGHIRPGDRVRLEGWLVEWRPPQGRTWRSSLTRNDTGAGACELLRVDHVEREPAPQ